MITGGKDAGNGVTPRAAPPFDTFARNRIRAPPVVGAGGGYDDGLILIAIPTSILIGTDGVVHAVRVGNITEPVMAFVEVIASGLE